MRQIQVALLALVALLAPSATAQDATFHTEVHLVTLTFSVHDANGKAVPGLTENDFHITEDGVPQKIASFSRESELPLKIGLLVDVSDSQSKFLKRHIQDVEAFLHEILRPQDAAFALCFGDHLRLTSDLTASPATIIDGLQRFDKHGDSLTELNPDPTRSGGTALFDAVHSSIQEKLANAPASRRVLILFTDGEENSSAHDEVDAIAAAQSADTLIYAVRYTEIHHGKLSAANRQGAANLLHLTTQTGGIDFDGLHTNLSEAFHQIAEELRSQYSIGYYSTNKNNDGSFRKVAIESVQSGLAVRARAGYYTRNQVNE